MGRCVVENCHPCADPVAVTRQFLNERNNRRALNRQRPFPAALAATAPVCEMHAVAEEGAATRDITAALGQLLRVPVESIPADRAQPRGCSGANDEIGDGSEGRDATEDCKKNCHIHLQGTFPPRNPRRLVEGLIRPHGLQLGEMPPHARQPAVARRQPCAPPAKQARSGYRVKSCISRRLASLAGRWGPVRQPSCAPAFRRP